MKYKKGIKMKKLNIWMLSLLLGSISEGALSAAAASGFGDEDPSGNGGQYRRIVGAAAAAASSAEVFVEDSPAAAAAASSAETPSKSPEELAEQFIADYNVQINKERVVRAFEDIQAGRTAFGEIIPGDLDKIATASRCLLKDGMDGSLMEEIIDCVFHASIDFAKDLTLSSLTKRTSYLIPEDATGFTISYTLPVVASIPPEEFSERFSRAKIVFQAETNLKLLNTYQLHTYQNHRMVELVNTKLDEEIYEDEDQRSLVDAEIKKIYWERRGPLAMWARADHSA